MRVHGTATLGSILKKALTGAPATAVGRILFEQMTSASWKVLVQAGTGYDQRIADALICGIKAAFGGESSVVIELVSEIPREPSGKFRFYRAARQPVSS